MQTFLPYSDVYAVAKVLDYRRLGKQRVEAKQIWQTLNGEKDGWKNHPAVKMWEGYEPYLAFYGYVICREWAQRGYVDNLTPFFFDRMNPSITPWWFGNEKFHYSHQSNLLRKDPDHYGQYFDISPDLPYYWPKYEDREPFGGFVEALERDVLAWKGL